MKSLDGTATKEIYQPREAVLWSVEQTGIRVFDELGGKEMALEYPEAAVWDLIARGQPVARTVEVFRYAAGQTAEEAAEFVRQCVSQWHEEKWIGFLGTNGNNDKYLDHHNL
jgi:hypothetical protein